MTERHKHLAIWELDCRARCFAISLCLTDSDLRRLHAWPGEPSPEGLSPSTWGRMFLQLECRAAAGIAGQVQALLDLRHAGQIMYLRSLGKRELEADFRAEVAGGLPDVAGYFWGLVTDPRPEAQRLGNLLSQEVFAQACQEVLAIAPEARHD